MSATRVRCAMSIPAPTSPPGAAPARRPPPAPRPPPRPLPPPPPRGGLGVASGLCPPPPLGPPPPPKSGGPPLPPRLVGYHRHDHRLQRGRYRRGPPGSRSVPL